MKDAVTMFLKASAQTQPHFGTAFIRDIRYKSAAFDYAPGVPVSEDQLVTICRTVQQRQDPGDKVSIELDLYPGQTSKIYATDYAGKFAPDTLGSIKITVDKRLADITIRCRLDDEPTRKQVEAKISEEIVALLAEQGVPVEEKQGQVIMNGDYPADSWHATYTPPSKPAG